MNKENTQLNEILEIVGFIKDNAASKQDITNLRSELKQDIATLDKKIDTVKFEMIEHIDGFVAITKKHDADIAAVKQRQDRTEPKLDAVIKHLDLELN